MKLLPVAERELRVSSRHRGTYWARFAAGFAAILLSLLVLLSMLRDPPREQAQGVFMALSSLAFLYALMGGVLTTSDCISEEKREGTLGLLFLTNLRGYDVIIGKVAASSLKSVSGLVALLPILGVPLLMGSISGAHVWNVMLVLLNTMFLSLAVGVLVSVCVKEARQAVGASVLALLILVLGLPIARWFFIEYVILRGTQGQVRMTAMQVEHIEWVLYTNPFMLLVWGGFPVFGTLSLNKFWTGLAVQHGVAWVALLGSCLILSRTWRDRVENRASRKVRGSNSKADSSGLGSPGTERGPARSVVGDAHPFAWLITRDRRHRRGTWVGLGVGAALWLWGYAELKEEWLTEGVGLWMLWGAALWLKLRLVGVACRHLHEQRRSGALELVLCTAQTPQSLVAGQLRGLRQAMLPPAFAVGIAGLLLMVAAVRQDRFSRQSLEPLLMFLAVVLGLGFDLWALAWTGLWQGMKSMRYLQAVMVVILQVLVSPWLMLFIASIGLSFLNRYLGSQGVGVSWGRTEYAMLGTMGVLTAATNLVLAFTARRRLLRRFRGLALAHYGDGVLSEKAS